MEDENVIIENEDENTISGTLSFEPLEEGREPMNRETADDVLNALLGVGE